jgi:hypothetical protein
MPFITQGKTNWKFLSVPIILLVVIICVIIFIGAEKNTEETSAEKHIGARDDRIISDIAQLRAEAEIVYVSEGGYASFACAHDETTEAICNDVEKYGGTKPIIRSTYSEYCAYVPLLWGNDYFCIDSQGRAIRTVISPSDSGYCTGITFSCPSSQAVGIE